MYDNAIKIYKKNCNKACKNSFWDLYSNHNNINLLINTEWSISDLLILSPFFLFSSSLYFFVFLVASVFPPFFSLSLVFFCSFSLGHVLYSLFLLSYLTVILPYLLSFFYFLFSILGSVLDATIWREYRIY